MQNTITIKETNYPFNPETNLGAIELGLGLTAMVIIIVLMRKLIYWQNKFTELYNSMIEDVTDLQRKLNSQKNEYENKIDKLEEVIHNLEKNK